MAEPGRTALSALAVDDSHGPAGGRRRLSGLDHGSTPGEHPRGHRGRPGGGQLLRHHRSELRGVGFRRVGRPKDGLQVWRPPCVLGGLPGGGGGRDLWRRLPRAPRPDLRRATFTLAPNTRWVRLRSTRRWHAPGAIPSTSPLSGARRPSRVSTRRATDKKGAGNLPACLRHQQRCRPPPAEGGLAATDCSPPGTALPTRSAGGRPGVVGSVGPPRQPPPRKPGAARPKQA